MCSESRTGSSDAVQLSQDALNRCSKRRAKFQWKPGLGRRAMSTCGLDGTCCNDTLQAAALGQER
eukprot:5615529-Pleurochrysis_carterae.AAC.1